MAAERVLPPQAQPHGRRDGPQNDKASEARADFSLKPGHEREMNETLRHLPVAFPLPRWRSCYRSSSSPCSGRPDGKLDQPRSDTLYGLDAASSGRSANSVAELGPTARRSGTSKPVLRDRAEQAQALERFGQGWRGRSATGRCRAIAVRGLGQHLNRLTQSFDARVEQLRLTVETRLGAIQTENAAKLEEMRKTETTRSCTPRWSSARRILQARLRAAGTGASRPRRMQTLAAASATSRRC